MTSRSVAIVGFCEETMDLHRGSDVDEIWTVNKAYKKDLERIDRLYAMHSLEWIQSEDDGDEMMEWLSQDHPFPIFMPEVHTEIPSSKAYPLVVMISTLLEHVTRGNEPIVYLNSGISYMLAHAALDQFERVEIYGVESGYFEYLHQRTAVEFWLGYLGGRGIEVVIPEESSLCNTILYGYEPRIELNKRVLQDYIEKYVLIVTESEDKKNKEYYTNCGALIALRELESQKDYWIDKYTLGIMHLRYWHEFMRSKDIVKRAREIKDPMTDELMIYSLTVNGALQMISLLVHEHRLFDESEKIENIGATIER